MANFFNNLFSIPSKQVPTNQKDLLGQVQGLVKEKNFKKALSVILDNQKLIKLDTEAESKLLECKKECVIGVCLQCRETAHKLFFLKRDHDQALEMYKELDVFMKNNLELFQISEKEYKDLGLQFYAQLVESVTNRDNPEEPFHMGNTIGPIREKLLKQVEEKYGESEKCIIFDALVECTVSEFSIPLLKKRKS